MVDAIRAQLISDMLSAIRAGLSQRGFVEILSPNLMHYAPVPFRPVYKIIDGKNNSLAVGQPSTESLARALAEIPRVYSLQSVYRVNNEGGPNHLPEFRYFKLGCRDDLTELLSVMESMIIELLGRFSELDFSDVSKRLTYEEAIATLGIPDGTELLLSNHLALIDHFAPDSPLLTITNIPTDLEPLQYDVDDSVNLFNADILIRNCGEVGGGYQVATGAATSKYIDSLYRSRAIGDGLSSIDQAAERYLALIDGLTGPLSYGGISFERLLQSVLKAAEISEVSLFPGELSIMRPGSGMT